ncbi:hypothetical protein ABZ154_09240 [Streptomyces sp. NPDC006261]|uniref:hypothetical protein n=1 Tax=Streptomyces sp. NPDC006261 TaxID=3156739 RepID=UPI0033B69B8F
MLQLITSIAAVQAPAGDDVLGMIYGGTIEETRTWVETSALLITECIGRPFGRYYMLVITNEVDASDVEELHRLSTELGRSLSECVVEKERMHQEHPFFPGSEYFDLVTVYGG